jgi:hypothetical protein
MLILPIDLSKLLWNQTKKEFMYKILSWSIKVVIKRNHRYINVLILSDVIKTSNSITMYKGSLPRTISWAVLSSTRDIHPMSNWNIKSDHSSSDCSSVSILLEYMINVGISLTFLWLSFRDKLRENWRGMKELWTVLLFSLILETDWVSQGLRFIQAKNH